MAVLGDPYFTTDAAPFRAGGVGGGDGGGRKKQKTVLGKDDGTHTNRPDTRRHRSGWL